MTKAIFRRLRAAVTILSIAGPVVCAPSASAAATCSFDPNTHVATVTSVDTTTIVRSNTDILVSGNACGTIFDIQKIVIDPGSIVTFNLSGGLFAPGFGDEAGTTDEIEIEINNDNSFGLQIDVTGGAGDEGIDIGSRLRSTDFVTVDTMNLNAGLERSGGTIDEDVTVVGGEIGSYVVRLQGGSDTISGTGLGTLLSRPTSESLNIYDHEGADTITGGEGNDSIQAPDFNDQADIYTGGGGTDSVSYQSRTSNIGVFLNGLPDDGANCVPNAIGCESDNIADDIERVLTGDGSDFIVGGPGPQFLAADDGNNVINGLGGDDSLRAGGGSDDFRGGEGFDRVARTFDSWSSDDPGIRVTLDGVANDGQEGENDNYRVDVEGVSGTLSADVLIGSDKDNELMGDFGNDMLRGGPGKDTLDGGGPLGIPAPFDGGDEIFGGPGVDTLAMHLAKDSDDGIAISLDNVANDGINGQTERDNVHRDVENVMGSPGPDALRGSRGANRLVGGDGSDSLFGLGGKDELLPGAGLDGLQGGDGIDTASYADASAAVIVDLTRGATGDGDDILAKIERVVGSTFGDDLAGSGGANILVGGNGNDTLRGRRGDDRLLGGLADDTLKGGPGQDICKQGPGAGSKTGCES